MSTVTVSPSASKPVALNLTSNGELSLPVQVYMHGAADAESPACSVTDSCSVIDSIGVGQPALADLSLK
jgi:hypothetical protein